MLRTWPEGPKRKVDAGESSDKPCKVTVTERVSLRNGVNSLVISWLGTRVARVLRIIAFELMVVWKGEHP